MSPNYMRTRHGARGSFAGRATVAAIATTSLILLAGCGASDGGDNGGDGGEDGIHVGYITLSGPAAATGAEVTRGIDLAVSEFNDEGGPKASVEICGDNADLNASTACTQKLITQEGIDYLLIDTTSANAAADVLVAKRQDVVTMIAGPRDSSLTNGDNDLLVRVNVNADVEGRSVAEQLVESLSPQRIAFLGTDNPYGREEAAVMSKVFEEAGASSVYESFFAPTVTDFSSQIASAASKKADLLICLGQVDQCAIIAKQAKAADLGARLVAASGAWTPDIVKLSDGAMEGEYGWTTFPESDAAASVAFRDAYKAKYDGSATSLAAEAYTGMIVLLKSIESAESGSSEDVAAALRSAAIDTPLGTTAFDENGQNTAAATQLQRVVDGKLVPLK